MNPTSARALAPRCAPAARAARAPCPGVAPPPAALRPCASPADSDLPPGLHQVRLRQLAAGPRALPVHGHPLGHLLPARLRRGMPPPNPAPAGRPGDRGSSFHVPKGGGESVCGQPGRHPDPGPTGSPASSSPTGALRGALFLPNLLRSGSLGRAPQAEPGPAGGSPGRGQSQGAENRGRAT